MKRIASLLVLATFATTPTYAETVLVRTKLPKTGTPAAQHNPPCEAATKDYSKTLGQEILDKGIDAVGQGVGQLGLGGGDPFNTRRLNKASCADLCATMPVGQKFSARGSITPIDWKGNLPSGLPETKDTQNYAAVAGPFSTSAGKVEMVCYTFKNWSHDQDRYVGVEFTY